MIHYFVQESALVIKIDHKSKEPLTEQIITGIRALMDDQILLPEEQLPPVRTLADQLKVNFNTVARAYRRLEAEGRITTRQGRGTFVVDTAIDHEQESPLAHDALLDDLFISLFDRAERLHISHQELLARMEEILGENAARNSAYRHVKRVTRRRVYTFHPPNAIMDDRPGRKRKQNKKSGNMAVQ